MHHEDRPLLQWIGIVGAVAFPLLYLLRLTSIVPPRYDDIGLRAVATLLCLLLALRRWWPAAQRRFYVGYSYLVVFYCLSFLLSFHGGRDDRSGLKLPASGPTYSDYDPSITSENDISRPISAYSSSNCLARAARSASARPPPRSNTPGSPLRAAAFH